MSSPLSGLKRRISRLSSVKGRNDEQEEINVMVIEEV